jgi:hypothetical protein
MDCRDNRLNLDVGHLEKIGRKVSRLLKKECRDAIEAMYVLKAILYVLRCDLSGVGVVLANEAQLDAELIEIIDKAISKNEVEG